MKRSFKLEIDEDGELRVIPKKPRVFTFPFPALLVELQRVIALECCSPVIRIALSLTSRECHRNFGLLPDATSPHTLLQWYMDERETYEEMIHYAAWYCSMELRRMRMYFYCMLHTTGDDRTRRKAVTDIYLFLNLTLFPQFMLLCREQRGLDAPLPKAILNLYTINGWNFDVYCESLSTLLHDPRRARSVYARSILDWIEQAWMHEERKYGRRMEQECRERQWCLRVVKDNPEDHTTWRLVVVE